VIRIDSKARVLLVIGIVCSTAGDSLAQQVFTGAEHVTFDSPEGWALKYFTSATIMSGLQPPEPLDEHRQAGAINVGFEAEWLPALNPERARVGFSGGKQEDVNKAPVVMRPVVRVGLPWRFTAVVAPIPPIEMFGVTPRLVAFGLERPIVQRERWTLALRGSGQIGSIKAAFTCPQKVLAFAPGSPENPTSCVGTSADVASLRYGGAELQATYRIPQIRRLVPHAALGVNYINANFQIDAPVVKGIDRTSLWTSGKTYTGTAGVSYFLTRRMALTVDTFYTPLFIRHDGTGGRANDGLFNVRALVSYSLR
jgi:hypothetical protein